MKKTEKTAVEVLLGDVELTALPERRLLLSHNLLSVDLVWPRTGVASKSAACELALKLGKAAFGERTWCEGVLFREEVEGHCGFAVSVTEPVTLQKLRRFLRLTAKFALKAGKVEMLAAPMDALSAMVAEKDAPKVTARGFADLAELPAEGEETVVEVPLKRPLTGLPAGVVRLRVRGM